MFDPNLALSSGDRDANVPADRLIAIGFDPATMITSLDVDYQITDDIPPEMIAQMIDPVMWHDEEFFAASRWLDATPDPVTGGCSGLFYEHLAFEVVHELLRSVENHLRIDYSGWDPERGRTRIRCNFNLHSSVDHLLTIDRGWYQGEPIGDHGWHITMRKEIRFADATNAILAPTLLAYWQQASMTDLARRFALTPTPVGVRT